MFVYVRVYVWSRFSCLFRTFILVVLVTWSGGSEKWGSAR